MTSDTGIVRHDLYKEHLADFPHVESPQRLEAIYEMLDSDDMEGKLTRISPRPATHDELKWVHSEAHVEKLARSDKEAIVRMAENAATDVGATVLGKGSVSYPGRGITAVIFLAESHILVSTYPEYRYAIVEIFMSNSRTDPGECWNWLYEYLQPARMSVNRDVHYVGDGNGVALHKASGKLI